MKWLLGEKREMTREYDAKGNARSVTVVFVSPNTIVGTKTKERDGYVAVQLGFSEKKHVAKPQRVAFQDAWSGVQNKSFRYIKEGRIDSVDGISKGDTVSCDLFNVGDFVDVIGWSKGHGFTGVVKRHGFHGHPATHGHKDQLRMPGSIGSGGVQHVFKGLRMAGRMGNDQVTVRGLEVLSIDLEKNCISLAGSIPGARNGLLILRGKGDFVTQKKSEKSIKEDDKPVDVIPSTEENSIEETKPDLPPVELTKEEESPL